LVCEIADAGFPKLDMNGIKKLVDIPESNDTEEKS
jgi:hypothetical protein